MKNFYEATVTKPNLKLQVVLTVKPVGNVKARLQINGASWTTEITKEEQFRHDINLTDPIDVQIQINRTYPEALEIELTVDGHKVLPLYQIALGISTCYIDNNNSWSVKIPNFYSWYHETTGQGWII